VRAELEQAAEQDPDARFVAQFENLWTSRTMHIYGMKMRAQGRGLSLAKKLRETLKQMLDQGLL
jgi:hypothetical protein